MRNKVFKLILEYGTLLYLGCLKAFKTFRLVPDWAFESSEVPILIKYVPSSIDSKTEFVIQCAAVKTCLEHNLKYEINSIRNSTTPCSYRLVIIEPPQ